MMIGLNNKIRDHLKRARKESLESKETHLIAIKERKKWVGLNRNVSRSVLYVVCMIHIFLV